MTLKLYIVVDHELLPGAKAAQSAHALAQLALDHPREFRDWDNGTLVLLETGEVDELEKLVRAAEDGGFTYAKFIEPDCLPYRNFYGNVSHAKNMVTAVAFAPNWLVQHVLLAHLPTALSTETNGLRVLDMEQGRKRWWQ